MYKEIAMNSNIRLAEIDSVEMYSKTACPFCVKAKQFLDNRNIPYDEYLVGGAATKRDIQTRVDAMGENVEVRTVPQIFAQVDSDWHYIGGYEELTKVRP